MLTPAVAEGMTKAGEDDVVFLLDIDNTLLDNDRFAADLGERLQQDFGTDGRDRYWARYASVRETLGYADHLATLQQFRTGLDDDPDLLQMSGFMLDYPFAERLYPGALAAVASRSWPAQRSSRGRGRRSSSRRPPPRTPACTSIACARSISV